MLVRPTDMTIEERNAAELMHDGPYSDQAAADARTMSRTKHAYTPDLKMAHCLRVSAKHLREGAMRDLEAITSLLDKRAKSTDEKDRAWYMTQADKRARGYELSMDQAEDYEREAAEIERELEAVKEAAE